MRPSTLIIVGCLVASAAGAAGVWLRAGALWDPALREVLAVVPDGGGAVVVRDLATLKEAARLAGWAGGASLALNLEAAGADSRRPLGLWMPGGPEPVADRVGYVPVASVEAVPRLLEGLAGETVSEADGVLQAGPWSGLHTRGYAALCRCSPQRLQDAVWASLLVSAGDAHLSALGPRARGWRVAWAGPPDPAMAPLPVGVAEGLDALTGVLREGAAGWEVDARLPGPEWVLARLVEGEVGADGVGSRLHEHLAVALTVRLDWPAGLPVELGPVAGAADWVRRRTGLEASVVLPWVDGPLAVGLLAGSRDTWVGWAQVQDVDAVRAALEASDLPLRSTSTEHAGLAWWEGPRGAGVTLVGDQVVATTADASTVARLLASGGDVAADGSPAPLSLRGEVARLGLSGSPAWVDLRAEVGAGGLTVTGRVAEVDGVRGP